MQTPVFSHHPPDLMVKARRHLADLDPVLARAEAATPPVSWRGRPGGFIGLAKMIVEQQVSVAAARTIWNRLVEGVGAVEPDRVLLHDELGLRSFGLSLPKARYIRGLAADVVEGRLDFDRVALMPDEEAVAALTSIKGVGRWTAETYLMFCHGRLDVFPVADVALQEALRVAEGAQARLGQAELAERALAWRPYRSVAAHLLWAYYGVLKTKDA